MCEFNLNEKEELSNNKITNTKVKYQIFFQRTKTTLKASGITPSNIERVL